MKTDILYVLLPLSLLFGCDLERGDTGDTSDPGVASCALSDDVETVLLENATGLTEAAVFVGQVTESSVLEYVYAISLYDQVESAGWLFFIGCDSSGTTFEPTCQGLEEEGYWDCVRPTCVDEDTLEIDAWYTTYGSTEPAEDVSFSLDMAETGGTLWFTAEPHHTITMAAAGEYTEVSLEHEVTAAHIGSDGEVTDVSYAVTGTVQHGASHPAFEMNIDYPGLEEGHAWSMVLSFDEVALAGTVLRDGVEVATVQDVTAEGEHDLALEMSWEDCEAEASLKPDRDIGWTTCRGDARVDCDPVPEM